MASSVSAVGGGDDAAIAFVAGAPADGADFLFLQDAEEFALGVNGHFGDFVQEEGAALGLLEQSLAVHVGAGEGAFDGAEQFAFDQFAGQGGAIDFDERPLVARAEVVNQIGDDFLAGPALAGDHQKISALCRRPRFLWKPPLRS